MAFGPGKMLYFPAREIGDKDIFSEGNFRLIEDDPSARPTPAKTIWRDNLGPKIDDAYTYSVDGLGVTISPPSTISPIMLSGML